MARRRRIADDEELDEEDAPPPRRGRKAPRPRRRGRLIVLLVSVVGLVVAAPAIVAKTPLRNLLLSGALPAGAGTLTCREASFSWAGGQSLVGVSHVDGAGARVFSAESVAVSRSLIGFASNSKNLGKVVITRPVVHLDTRVGGSNVEDLIQKIAAARQEPKPPGEEEAETATRIEIEVVEGVVHGRDVASGQQWRVDGLNVAGRPSGDAGAWDVNAAGVLTLATIAPLDVSGVGGVALEQPGRFKVHLHPGGGDEKGAGGGDAPARVEVELIGDRLPLAPLEPWLARVLPEARLTGDASADMQLTWTAPGPGRPGSLGEAQPHSFTAAGKLDAANVRFTAAALSGDLLELPTASATLDATLIGRRLSARQCTARTDWLQAELHGDFDLDELKKLSVKSLPTSDATITARAELPQLTRMLPRTLRLRPGVRVDAGTMELTARSATGDGGRRWTIAAAVESLLGSDGVRPIRWTKPVEIGVDAADSPAGPQLQRAILRAAFATATADGAAGGLEGKLEFDLDELGAQLGQFVDLSAWRLHGTGGGEFSLRDTGVDRFAASAKLDLKQIDVQRDGKVVWQDPELHVEIASNGNRQGLRPLRVDAATFTMRGPADMLTAELLEPVDLADLKHSWLVKVSGNGPLELWAGRVRPWVAGVPEQLAGQSTVSAQLRAGAGLLHVIESKLSVKEFRAQVGPTAILEPRLEAAGDFRWDAAQRAVESQDFQVSSSTVAARARGLSVKLVDAGPPTVRGDVAFRGDFERLAAWGDLFGASQEGLRPRGEGVGRLQLASDADRATANLTLKAEPFQLINAADGTTAWNEPRVELATEAVYTNGDDRLQLSKVRLTGKTVQMSGAGVVEQLRTAGVVRGDMSVSYDAAELATLLTAYLGPGVQFTGANTARVQATGRLHPDASRGVSVPESPNRFATSITPPLAPPHQGEGDQSWNAGPPSISSRLRLPNSILRTHWSRRWQVTTETGWAAANFYGLPVGAAKVTANVREGQIQFTPLELAVGQGGRISLQPRILLDPPPQRLDLAPGQLISNVAISADVSERLLKYAAPIVAGATRAEGSFSFFLNGAEIPLRQPKQGRLDGRLTIHNLAVTPGPMIQSVATLIRQIEAIGKNAQGVGQGPLGLGGLLGGAAPQGAQPIKGITMTERAIDIQVVDGRVYHRNLEFLVDDVPVRSQGSVGFDETLALEIEVPIQAKWVGSKPALQGLAGQTLRIPVTGTFNQPKVDERAIGAFLGQAAQAAAGGLLGDELNKALDKLLKPR